MPESAPNSVDLPVFGFPMRAIVQVLHSVAGGIGGTGERGSASKPSRAAMRSRSGRGTDRADHHAGAVIHPEPQPLAAEADDARPARPDHLDVGPVIQPHLPQPMHLVRLAE